MGPHDKLFRRLMRERGVAQALLEERLPGPLRKRLAGPPELLAESFVSPSMRGVMADVVLRAPLDGGDAAFVYCLVEHKRSEDPHALVQVLDYLNALYQHLSRVAPRGGLPLVVPMLIHNGARRWRGPTGFAELLGNTAGVRPFLLDFEVVLIDVAAEPITSLSAHPRLAGALQGLRAASLEGRRLVHTVERVLAAFEGDASTQRLFFNYLMRVVSPAAEKALRAASLERRSRAMQSLADFYKAQGLRRGRKLGREEGREEGLAEGRADAMRDAVRRVLLRRFKRLTPSVEARLAEADAATLERWHEAALDAKSLRGVFATH